MRILYALLALLLLSLSFSLGVWKGLSIQELSDRQQAKKDRLKGEADCVELLTEERQWSHLIALEVTDDKKQLDDAQAELKRLRRDRAILEPFFETGRLVVVGHPEP